jgi:ribosome-associated protein
MVAAAAAASAEKKAEETRILELDPSDSGFTDFFLITSGNNTRQVVAISDEIELRLKREFGTYPHSVEGRRQGEWVLMDYVDFVVHIFVAEKRAYYDIERLRKSATSMDIDDFATALKERVQAARKKSAAKKTSAAKRTTVKKDAVKKAAAGKKSVAKKAVSTQKTVKNMPKKGAK